MLTAPSSAELQPANQPKGFAQASKGWLQRWHADHRLSHSDRTFCTQLYLYFNELHFEKTGELLAWPSWNTLMARTGLSETSVFRRLRNLERLGALEIEHGRYNHETKRRAGNLYRARESNLAPVQPCKEKQPCISGQKQPCTGARRLGDRDSVNLREKEQVQFGFNAEERGLPRGRLAPEESKQASSSSRVPLPPPSKPNGGLPATAVGRVPRAAPNGGGDSVWVKYDTPTWDAVERYGQKAVGKVFIRYGRVEGAWILKADLRAIEAAATEGTAR
jgi:DNA-binding Lrp family transcriptional regulator